MVAQHAKIVAGHDQGMSMRGPSSVLARSGAAVLLVAAALSACVVVVEDDPGRPVGPAPAPICTRDYAPVCARRAGDHRTFANACLADAAGYRVISRGQCRRFEVEDRICTRIYAPVCARRAGHVRTFPNACEADVAGYRIVADGPC